ncbi:hypothetical protein CFK38_16970 [Brachybacterium vulturis]|uniref:Hrp-dependent type III effector protein n=1 Tax=Brachybacterium vulturis TaxID=2017484 RepID=A0A291GSC2_9MICO|nr:four-carbon acid sugar kinase family protein [Brachybacterium vulturis]ATG53020.1 hypothetical protein CFK38_16970 [Brachybacterium vulturis]
MTPPDRIVYVVLDDDPTGTQSIADLPILTSWTIEDISWALAQDRPAVYVLTNSRSLSPDDAVRVNREVVSNSLAACPAGTRLEFISRSDSTLRGHFPLETDTIESARRTAGLPPSDALLIIPAFPEAGRVTRQGVHYTADSAGRKIPVGDSEYAADATFGYTSSDLRHWVEEKSQGHTRAADVTLLTLEQVRAGSVVVAQELMSARGVVVLDCETTRDLAVLTTAIRDVTATGRRLLYRVGPPFVRALIGQEPSPPLTTSEIARVRTEGAGPGMAGGLVVVGSHVPITTRQLTGLRERHSIFDVEIDVARVMDDTDRQAHLDQAVEALLDHLPHGNAVVSTSRTVIRAQSGDASLEIARGVSAALVHVVQRVLSAGRPRFVVAKGGITSSDVATHGLGFRRAWAHGSMLPGLVSLWSAADGPAVGIPYVVFPGNVGDADALADVVTRLNAETPIRAA